MEADSEPEDDEEVGRSLTLSQSLTPKGKDVGKATHKRAKPTEGEEDDNADKM